MNISGICLSLSLSLKLGHMETIAALTRIRVWLEFTVRDTFAQLANPATGSLLSYRRLIVRGIRLFLHSVNVMRLRIDFRTIRRCLPYGSADVTISSARHARPRILRRDLRDDQRANEEEYQLQRLGLSTKSIRPVRDIARESLGYAQAPALLR